MAFFYQNPATLKAESLSTADRALLSSVGKGISWRDPEGPSSLSFSDVGKALKSVRYEVRGLLENIDLSAIPDALRGNSVVKKYKSIHSAWVERVEFHKEKEQATIGAAPNFTHPHRVYLDKQVFDITNPVNSLTTFLLQHRHRLFFSYSPKEVGTMILKLRSVLSEVMREYDELDRRHGMREDGTTRFSHAWETMIIRISYGNFTIQDIFSCLLHDYMEDVEEGDDKKEATLRDILSDYNAKFDIAEQVITTVKKLTKHPLEYYLGKHYKNRAALQYLGRPRARKDYLQRRVQAEEKHLKKLRTEDYYGRMNTYTHTEFLDKCADREHALTHFHTEANKEKIVRKIEETQRYFLPEIRRRKLQRLGKWNNSFLNVEVRLRKSMQRLEDRFGLPKT